MRGSATLYLEFPFWKLPLLIISAFKGVNFQKRLFTPPPLGGILGPFNVTWWALDKHKVPTKYVGLIKDMYNNIVTSVRTSDGRHG